MGAWTLWRRVRSDYRRGFKHIGKGNAAVIATKGGMEMAPDKKGLSKRYIRQGVEDSLRRLQTDYIDLYQPRADEPAAPQEETLDAYAELIKQGKIHADPRLQLQRRAPAAGAEDSGFLTGTYRSEQDLAQSVRGQGVKKYMNKRGFRILAALDEVAKRYGATPAVVALAWLISRPTVTAPIASATSLTQLDDLMGAVDPKLDPEVLALPDQASA
jgi:aryl-alcohol dehydrogenase-like predicted oxidoreductase